MVKTNYHKLKVPITLVYGRSDWATENERENTKKLLGLKKYEIIENCGHNISAEASTLALKFIKENLNK